MGYNLNLQCKTGSYGIGQPLGEYPARSAYAALFHGQTALGGVKELWKSRAPNKCHFFLWLALQDCCWTAER
jgi:hypothetical protein